MKLVLLTVFAVACSWTTGLAQVVDEDTIALIPRARWPQPPASARPKDSLRALPTGYWARNLRAGEIRIIGGVYSAREPADTGRRLMFAGVPETAQPRLNFEPISGDTGTVRKRVRRQTMDYLNWSANHFGRQLPASSRRQLGALYRAAADSVAVLTARPAQTPVEADRVRARMARLVGTTLLRERRLFQNHPRAQRDRYGSFRQIPPGAPDTAALYRAVEAWLSHDIDTAPPAPPFPPRPQQPTIIRPRPFMQFPQTRPQVGQKFQFGCTGQDTVIITRQVDDWQPLPVYEARVYLMTHQAIQWIADVIEGLGVDTDWFYHSGVGAGIWQLNKTHWVRTTRLVPNCNSLIQTVTPTALAQTGTVIAADTTTAYDMLLVRWEIANGAAGDYANTDDKHLVAQVSFDTWDAAYKWLYTPTPTGGGKYYKVRSVAYSVGDYGTNWICQTSANAFTMRRWGFNVITNPTGAWLYGLHGNRGISEHTDMWNNTRYGCVPGRSCYYNVRPPYATGLFEALYDGIGYNLDTFWNKNLGTWAQTLASYRSVPPPWGSLTERVNEAPGWQ